MILGTLTPTRSMLMSAFQDRFAFGAANQRLPIGAEEEFLLTDLAGVPIPDSPRLLSALAEDLGFPPLLSDGVANEEILRAITAQTGIKPELSADQLEINTRPCGSIGELACDLLRTRTNVIQLAESHGLQMTPIAASLLGDPTDVFPTTRYLSIRNNLAAMQLRDANCCGLHIHVGISHSMQGLRVLNMLTPDLPYFLALSANSPFEHGISRRFFAYQRVAPHLLPPNGLNTWEEMDAVAAAQGFQNDPRRCWWMLRLNPVGTVELRVCDVQVTIERTVQLAAAFRTRIQAACATTDDAKSETPVDETLMALLAAASGQLPAEKIEQWVSETEALAEFCGLTEESRSLATLRATTARTGAAYQCAIAQHGILHTSLPTPNRIHRGLARAMKEECARAAATLAPAPTP